MEATRILRGLGAVRRFPGRAVVTIGMFDGVHLAHQQLIRSTLRLAQRLNGTSVAVTFHPDPQVVLEPARTHPALMPLAARLGCLRAFGVERVWVIPFSRRFSQLSAADFVRNILAQQLHAVGLVVGEGFAFGRDRRGNMDLLRRWGPRCGIRVVSVPSVVRGGMRVSSSRIRQLISQGRLRQAHRLLGRPPELFGVAVRGLGRGRRFGVPTVNIRLTSQVLPPQGVYAVLVRRSRHQPPWQGVMNLGVRPTFGPGPLVCETHLFNFSGAWRDTPISVALLLRLRGERRFSSPEVLYRQVHRDIRRARRLFARRRPAKSSVPFLPPASPQ